MTASAFINYKTRAGDTFDELALQVYNDERMAHHIIEANPDHADVIIFEESVPLRIPIFDETELPETLAPWRRGE
jgi:phage tail protein X